MPGLTVPMGYPYPLDVDRIDVAGDMKRLAEAIDNSIAGTQADIDHKVNKSGDTLTGLLTYNQGVTMPSASGHLIDIEYGNKFYLRVNGANPMTGPLELDNQDYNGINHATRREWQIETFVQASGDLMTGNLVMNGTSSNPANIFLRDPPSTAADAVMPKHWIDDRLATKVNRDGASITSNLDMNGNQIVALGDPTAAAHALNLGHGNSIYVRKDGSTMTGGLTMSANINMGDNAITNVGSIGMGGVISMNNNEITGVKDPAAAQQAMNLQYANSHYAPKALLDELTSRVDALEARL